MFDVLSVFFGGCTMFLMLGTEYSMKSEISSILMGVSSVPALKRDLWLQEDTYFFWMLFSMNCEIS